MFFKLKLASIALCVMGILITPLSYADYKNDYIPLVVGAQYTYKNTRTGKLRKYEIRSIETAHGEMFFGSDTPRDEKSDLKVKGFFVLFYHHQGYFPGWGGYLKSKNAYFQIRVPKDGSMTGPSDHTLANFKKRKIFSRPVKVGDTSEYFSKPDESGSRYKTTTKVIGQENVTVPAGSFKKALAVLVKQELYKKNGMLNKEAAVEKSKFWLARGIGIIKMPGGELVSYSFPK